MKISFLIVTRNRPEELRFTLEKLKLIIDLSMHEVLVLIDDCDATTPLIPQFEWVKWTVSNINLSASPARNLLYKKATGELFIGLDDDAHPLSYRFIDAVESRFRESETLGIIAFQEVRGLFTSNEEALKTANNGTFYQTNEFVGCGFAISKKAYYSTNGFPLWMNIYGEESAVSIEAMDAGYEIYYDYHIMVNHRVDVVKRAQQGRNYFRFENQLRNTLRFYMVYYPSPVKKVLKTLYHNGKKYALTDFKYLSLYFKVVGSMLWNVRFIKKYRKTISQSTIDQRASLKPLHF